MKSIIYTSEVVTNSNRVFGAANEYFPCDIELPTGDRAFALFTYDELVVAVERGKKNPEDRPLVWYQKFARWMMGD